jgi:7,8-dihydropterin-6-yl-methyl-4-(beta-D-ribofuranosyl)aminobenzene 5'-phosphate synthase
MTRRAPLASSENKITVLVDNHAGQGLGAEHGLSLWIETEGKRILFDTGKGGSLQRNAAALGIDLDETDVLVLSHGHYDHTGGIPQVLLPGRSIDVYCHPSVRKSRYSVRSPRGAKSIGIPTASLEALDDWPPARVHWVEGTLMLSETVGLAAPIPRMTSYEDTGGPFYFDQEGKQADLIEDDLALWIRTERGLIVCTGCAHSGVVNVLDHICTLTQGEKIHTVLGGFHLGEAGPERLERTVAALRALEPDLLIPCHCTGESAFSLLAEALGDVVTPCAAGMTFRG